MAGRQPFDMDATAGAIYIVRNPLDIAASYARHTGVPIDEIITVMSTPNHMLPRNDRLAEFVQGGWSQHVMSWTRTPNPAVHIMRYEDLAADCLRDLWQCPVVSLKLDLEPDRIARAVEHASIDTMRRGLRMNRVSTRRAIIRIGSLAKAVSVLGSANSARIRPGRLSSVIATR